ncbi:MAG TPA: tetratricopeptide repeat protein [Kofleriaceae bacterium]|nr:tetratricopeptide repeat protein [Kofleriaceae bacterium]
MNKAAEAKHNKQIESAVIEYKEAVRIYPENHSAYYGLGATYIDRGNQWKEASDAFGNAVRIKDDEPMYHMWYGIALYKDALEQRKQQQAKNENKKPEEVDVDLKGVNLDPSLQQLQAALKLNNELWRAHYYVGVIYRDQDKPQLAAQEFTAAIQNNPFEPAPYIALGELYRKWDYTDQAIQVASQGQANVPGDTEREKIDFVLGMAYLDKKNLDAAIESFTKSIEDSKKADHSALFERGLTYAAKGDTKAAKKDLEEYSKVAGAKEEFNKSMANKVLMDIASKQN